MGNCILAESSIWRKAMILQKITFDALEHNLRVIEPLINLNEIKQC